MPPAVGVAIAGIAGGLAQIGGAKMQSSAAKRGGQAQAEAAAQALAFQREQDAKDRAQYNQEYQRTTMLEDQQRALEAERYGQRQQRLQPYQDAGTSAVRNISSLLGNAPPIPVGRTSRRPIDLMM